MKVVKTRMGWELDCSRSGDDYGKVDDMQGKLLGRAAVDDKLKA